MLRYLAITQKTCDVTTGVTLDYPSDGSSLWLFLTSPTPEEIQSVTKTFQLDPKLFYDYRRQVRSKRYTTSPLQFVMVDYFLDAYANIKKTNILIIIKKNVFITVIPDRHKNYEDLYDEIVEDIKHYEKTERNIGQVLYEFLDRDVQENYDVLKTTEEDIVEIEKLILSDGAITGNVSKLLQHKKDLSAMSRRFWATAKIIFLIKKGLISIAVSQRTLRLLDDVYDTFQHQITIIASQRDMLGDALTLYETALSNKLAKSSNELNHIMKTLTSLTLLVMIPTLIASVYGMNFAIIPGANSTTGFYEAIGMMLLSGLLLYILFHRKKWI